MSRHSGNLAIATRAYQVEITPTGFNVLDKSVRPFAPVTDVFQREPILQHVSDELRQIMEELEPRGPGMR